LRALVEVAGEVLHADKTSVHLWEADRGEFVVAAAHGYREDSIIETLAPDQDGFLNGAMQGSVLVLEDAASDPRLSQRLRNIVERENVQSAIGAPISVSGQLFGLFGVAFCRSHKPSLQDQRLVQALAQRAGLAIQNARLFEQAQQVATAEERERLARELHDAVTQTLFSASLIAEAVPHLWERDPDEGRRRIEELRRLTRGALSEMRTLLLELRPASLMEAPLGQLLKQLAETAASRANLEVSIRSDGDAWSLPPEVHLVVYRVVQEALNNTCKHGAATHATVHVRWRHDGLHARVTDNGRGFEPRADTRGRLGLVIMQERARAVGARLRIQSQLGHGTTVDLHWRKSAR
jgi:signal transduction histidine kinase